MEGPLECVPHLVTVVRGNISWYWFSHVRMGVASSDGLSCVLWLFSLGQGANILT
ncbi:hypothetical protein BCR42DRAFT_417496 [Absidia repens]|uniref:Uncharacterized protein n=1 Tax=Absidia repens TaxID=90262 RepID=A0A1X2IEC0_9FUNG|nr:hypothetical protein BCR42DRAFT_417496 [Absidia repens]